MDGWWLQNSVNVLKATAHIKMVKMVNDMLYLAQLKKTEKYILINHHKNVHTVKWTDVKCYARSVFMYVYTHTPTFQNKIQTIPVTSTVPLLLFLSHSL